jgi:hypothetical protein
VIRRASVECHDLDVTDEPEGARPTAPVLTDLSYGRRVQLAFSEYQLVDAYVGEYLVFVSAAGLDVRSPVLTSLGGDGLPDFIRGLADSFPGWSDTRRWRSLEDQLRLEATWQSGGHVALHFQVRPSVYDKWMLNVEFTLDAGEEMNLLSEDLRAFFND